MSAGLKLKHVVFCATSLFLGSSTYAQTIDGCPMYGCRPSGTFSFSLSAPRANATIGWVTDIFLGPIPEGLGCVGNTISLICQSNGPGPGDTSIVKKVLATYINHSRHLIPDGIHRHEDMREEKPDSSFYAERQAGERGLVSIYLDSGTVRWRDFVLRFPTLPVLDEEGSLWGTDGTSLMHYDANGKPLVQIELEPHIRPLFGLQYLDPGLILFVSETGQISTRLSGDGTPMAELYLRDIVQRAKGTFIPTAPAVVNGNRFYVLTEFAPDDGEEAINLGLQRLYAIDTFDTMGERIKVAWYANFERERPAENRSRLRYRTKFLKRRLVQKIKDQSLKKPSLLWDSFQQTVYVSLPPPMLGTRGRQNGIDSLLGIKDFGNDSALIFKVDRSALNMALFEMNRRPDATPNAGPQLWISLSDGTLLAIEPNGNISKALDVSKILKTNFTVTSKISSARSREVDEDFLLFGIKVTEPTDEFRSLIQSFGIDTTKATPTCYVVGVDTPENSDVPNSMVWIVPTPDDTVVNGQIIGVIGDNYGRKDQIIVFSQVDEKFGKIFSIV